MDIASRIAQFENMVQADPANDMAHFSLGGAYNQAGRFLDAAESFVRCIQINPAMSKAYQMAGAAYMAAGQTSKAGEVLTDGYKAAAEAGDRMPMKAMGDLLKQLGQPVPEVKGAGAETATLPEGTFVCRQTGRPGTKMARPPFKGPVGAWIAENISRQTFEDWIKQGTKVINELRLDLSREQDGATYDQHMREFLGIDEELYATLMGKQ